jgi:hypothetical protein
MNNQTKILLIILTLYISAIIYLFISDKHCFDSSTLSFHRVADCNHINGE